MSTVGTVVGNSGLSCLPDSHRCCAEDHIAGCDVEILLAVIQGVFATGQTCLEADLAPVVSP